MLPFVLLAQNNILTKTKIDKFEFRKVSDSKIKWMPATVPGTVHTDLLKNQIIENPYTATNESKLQWIEKEDWEYKSEFVITSEVFNKENIEILFEGIDTYADVFINKTKVASVNNMYRTWAFDIKPLVKEGTNELVIYFHSAYNFALKEADKYKMKLPAGNDRGNVKTSVFTRKAPYHYGWDWGPRFVTCGIWRPVYIQSWNGIKINDLNFKLSDLHSDKASYNLRVDVDANESKVLMCKLRINGEEVASGSFKKEKGLVSISLPFEINAPILWWPNGYGSQYLYDAEVEISDGVNVDKKLQKLGVRTVKLIQTDDTEGQQFYFNVNGKSIFMKGANYIPMDVFIPSVTYGKKDSLLQMAVSAHMNMLRVWGGGVYEDDDFYNMCDKYGIMVWQDFMFACSLYPWDEGFLSNVKQEAIDNIKRIRNHASLALWCGNNEIDEAWHNWGWQKQYGWNASDSTAIWHGYQSIFEKLLPEMIEGYDSQHSYISSSPKIGWGNAESYKSGDSHYWGVWWGMAPFETYKTKIGRFASEYGFQSIPDLLTLQQYIPKKQLKLTSESMLMHQKSATGFETIDKYRKWYYPATKSMEQIVYESQLVQAYGIKTAIENHRRNMPYCMGTLYWQLNDCWPAVSWSSIDYTLQPKALQYQVKRSYATVLISAEKKNDKLEIIVVSDSINAVKGKMKLVLADFSGRNVWQKQMDIAIDANGKTKIELNYTELFKQQDSISTFLRMEILDNQRVVSNANYFFCLPKYLVLPKEVPTMKVKKINENDYEITLKSRGLIKDACIMPSDIGLLSDNYFDLLPGQEKVVHFKTNMIGNAAFRVISLNELGGK